MSAINNVQDEIIEELLSIHNDLYIDEELSELIEECLEEE